jgi:holo-[acyl-carrier protein] synthase
VSGTRTAVGVDLVAIDAVANSLATFDERYLRRVYTERERSDCRMPDGTLDAGRLAARFAAKEAALKVLRRADEAVPWRSVGVVRDANGHPALELAGAAQALATRHGIERLDVSITHEGAFAAAVVVAQVRDREWSDPAGPPGGGTPRL